MSPTRIGRWNPFGEWHIYTIPSSFLSLRVALALLVFSLVGGTLVFMALEEYTLNEAFYMAVITVSTVGYTELRPLTEDGRLFNSMYILLNIGIFAYVVSVFSYYITQGEIFKNMHLNLIKSNIDKLNDHVILCGFGKYGHEIATHFMLQGLDFVIIENSPEQIERIQNDSRKFLYLEADATSDDSLVKAGIHRARALITALADDSDNLFIVLTARQLNPRMEIVSRARSEKTQRKLRLAGANHMIMPEQIGGFYIATLISKPGAVEFFSFITNQYKSDIGFEEIAFEDMPEDVRHKTIRDLKIRKETGANIIGYKSPEGHYIVNPEPDTALLAGSSFIVLGNREQLQALREMCKIEADDTAQP